MMYWNIVAHSHEIFLSLKKRQVESLCEKTNSGQHGGPQLRDNTVTRPGQEYSQRLYKSSCVIHTFSAKKTWRSHSPELRAGLIPFVYICWVENPSLEGWKELLCIFFSFSQSLVLSFLPKGPACELQAGIFPELPGPAKPHTYDL